MRETPRKTLGCGSEEHSSDCLCDVDLSRITTTTEVRLESRIADTAIRILSRTYPGRWTTLDAMKAIAVVTEAAAARTAQGDDANTSTKLARGVEAHLSYGHSMSDACRFFSRSLEEIVFTITMGKPNRTWAWGLDEWDEFIADIQGMPHNGLNLLTLARKWGVTDRLTSRWVAAVNPLYVPTRGGDRRKQVQAS